jgi:hypothetical protein
MSEKQDERMAFFQYTLLSFVFCLATATAGELPSKQKERGEKMKYFTDHREQKFNKSMYIDNEKKNP